MREHVRCRRALLLYSAVHLDSQSAQVLFPFALQEPTEEVVGSPIPEPRQRSRLFRSHSESSDEQSELDLSHGKKDAFVLEVCINTTCVNAIISMDKFKNLLSFP